MSQAKITDHTDSDEEDPCCKATRVIEKYDLDIDLVEKTLEEEVSRRNLAELLNLKIIEAVLRENNAELTIHPERLYEILKDNNATGPTRGDIKERLGAAGIDPEEFVDDFCSHMAIQVHINGCLGIDQRKEQNNTRDIPNLISHANHGKDQIRNTVNSGIKSQLRQENIKLGDYDLKLNIMIRCHDCGYAGRMPEMLHRGGCNCPTGQTGRS